MADVFVAFSILHSDAIVRPMRHVSRNETWKEGEKKRRKKNEKERRRNAVASPTRNRTLPNAEEEGRLRARERNLRADAHPRRPPALPTCCYTKLQIRCFAICRRTSMCDTVRYDMIHGGDGREKRHADRWRSWRSKLKDITLNVSKLLRQILRGNIPLVGLICISS